MSDILLIPMTETDARLILSGDRADDWSAGYPTPGDLEVADRIVSRQMPVAGDASPWGPWIVRSENLIVGGAGFRREPDAAGDVEIGYGIAVEARGCGLATAAVRLLLTLARDGGARRVVAGTDPDNVASERVLSRCGLRRTGVDGDERRWAIDVNPPA